MISPPPSQAPSVLGAIIAGGQSRRFGTDKAEAIFEGRCLIDHVIGAMVPQVDALLICGRRWRGWTSIADRPATGLGPLGGLYAALLLGKQHGYSHILSAPVDVLPLPGDLRHRLIASGPRILGEQYLIGGWPTSLAEALKQHLIEGHRSLRSWLKKSEAECVPDPGVRHNINHRHCLTRLANKAKAQHASTGETANGVGEAGPAEGLKSIARDLENRKINIFQ